MDTTTNPQINADRLAELEKMDLDHGGHASFSEGHCAMEAVAWLAGEAHSDAPACACPVVAKAVIRLNDRIKDKAIRTELLRPLLPRIVGSRASRAVMVKRGFIAADMAVHVFAPLSLEKRGRLDLAEKLRGAPEIVDEASAREARKIAGEVRSAAADAAADAAYADYAAAAAAAYAADAAADAAYAADAADYAAAAADAAADADADYAAAAADAADADYADYAAYAADAAAYAAAAAAADAAYAADAADADYAAYAADAAAYAAADADYAAARNEARKPIWQLGVQMIEKMLDVRE